MKLTDKLKKAGKALGIAGMLASPVYNSGCVPLAIVGGAAIISKSNRDAAQIEARNRNANGRPVFYNDKYRCWVYINENGLMFDADTNRIIIRPEDHLPRRY